MNLNYEQLLWTSIISASVIAGILASFLNFIANFITAKFTKNKEYKNKYFELIMNKRMEAYEKTLIVINKLFQTNVHAIDKSLILSILNEPSSLIDFKAEWNSNIGSSYWLSSKTSGHIQELDLHLHNLINEISHNDEKQEYINLLKVSTEETEKIRILRYDIINSLSVDFKNLYKIDDFLNKEVIKDYSKSAKMMYVKYPPTINP